MKKQIQRLETIELDILKSHFKTSVFKSDFDLIYEEQIPNIGIVLVEGEIELLYKKKSLTLNSPGSIIGLHNLIDNLPFKFKCRVRKDTQLILLSKTEISLIHNEKQSSLYKMFFQSEIKKLQLYNFQSHKELNGKL